MFTGIYPLSPCAALRRPAPPCAALCRHVCLVCRVGFLFLIFALIRLATPFRFTKTFYFSRHKSIDKSDNVLYNKSINWRCKRLTVAKAVHREVLRLFRDEVFNREVDQLVERTAYNLLLEQLAEVVRNDLHAFMRSRGIQVDEEGRTWRYGVRECESGFEAFFKQGDNGEEVVVKRYALFEEG